MRTVKIGMASFGMSGKVFHAPLIEAHPNLELSVVHERNSQKSKELYPNVKVVKEYDEMLADGTLEVIVVNTPQHLHFEMTRKALLAGKNVIVEKPFTVKKEEAQELISLSKKVNRVLTVFQNRRWDGDFLTVQKVLESQCLGSLVAFESHYDRFRNYIQEGTWKEEGSWAGSGLLYNLGSHMVDHSITLFGLPKSVFADIRTVRKGGKVDDFFKLLLYYDGLLVTLSSSYLVREPYPRFVLHGHSGSFIKYGLDPQEEALNQGLIPSSPNWGKDKEQFWGKLNTEIAGLHYEGKLETVAGNYMEFYNNIYENLTEGKELHVKPEDAMHNIMIIEAALESNQKRKSKDLVF